MKNQGKAYIYAVLAVTAWSTVASAFKLTLAHITSTQLLLGASLVSLLIYGSVCFVRKGCKATFTFTRKDLLSSAGLGFLNPFLYYLILFNAYNILPAQEALPLNLIWPIVLVLLSVPLLGQRVTALSLMAFMVSFAGVYVIATRGDLLAFSFSNPLGVALATGSSIIWALYWIGNVRDKREDVEKLFLNFVFGFLYSLLYAIFTGELTSIPWQGLAGMGYAGVFEMGLTFIFWLKALKYSESADKVSILIYIIPFASILIIGLIVGEEILPSSIIGSALIVAGILLQKLLTRRS